MKTAHRLIVTTLGLAFLNISVAVRAQFNYVTNNGTITITGYTGRGGDVTIPDRIPDNGLPVTSIGNYAFYRCWRLTSVTIPDCVSNIGDGAFSECTYLADVTIGRGVISIGDWAFVGCTYLTSISVDTLNSAYSSLGGVLFNKTQTTLVEYPAGIAATSYAIPSSVTNIGDSAFSNCTSLTSVTIPNSVTSIGGGAFSSCGLTNVVIPDTVTNIGYSAFYGCISLTNVTIGDSVTTIGDWAFDGCTSLTSVTIPNSVTSTGDGAFWDCTSLTSVTIPSSVTSTGDNAFLGCTSLTSVTIPNSVTSIGSSAFNGCISLTNVAIPDSVTNIGVLAFYNCTSLTNVTIPNSVTSIGLQTFSFCSSLASITIPDSVTSIAGWAFSDCTSLTNVMIGNGVTGIGTEAFENCSSLANVTIPSSVTGIGDYVFWDCTSLTSVFFQGNAPWASSYVFYVDSNATVYYLRGTTGWGATFGGRPTALWIQVPTIQTSPHTQTAEAGSAVSLRVEASSPLPLFYFWYLNGTNLITRSTNRDLELTNLQFAQSGAYSVVVSNALGAAASSPAMLNVIAAVDHKLAAGVKLMGDAGSVLNVDYANTLSATPKWLPLDTVTLVSTSQYCFDVTEPLPPQRFYRAWQTGTPSVMPSLDLHLVPAVTLTGSMGHSVRLDYINQFGPTDAWVTLATVTLTNTSQLYFDTSSIGQPARLYRLVP